MEPLVSFFEVLRFCIQGPASSSTKNHPLADARLPRTQRQEKKREGCGKELQLERLSVTERLEKEPTCMKCRPVGGRFQDRLQAAPCVECQKDLARDHYTDNQ